MNFQEAIEKAKEESKERNFNQSIDLIVNLKDLDLSDPNNRINEDLKLPYQADDEVKVAVIGDTIINQADNADLVIDKDELENKYFENPNEAKNLAEEYSFILAEAPLMPKIGQQLGQVLGPRNMMPEPVQPGEDPSEQVEDLRNTVTVRLKETPMLQLKIGTEEQEEDNVARNGSTILDFVEGELPQGRNNVKEVMIKTTMGPTVEVDN